MLFLYIKEHILPIALPGYIQPQNSLPKNNKVIKSIPKNIKLPFIIHILNFKIF
jgi:hypothetical protein